MIQLHFISAEVGDTALTTVGYNNDQSNTAVFDSTQYAGPTVLNSTYNGIPNIPPSTILPFSDKQTASNFQGTTVNCKYFKKSRITNL